jgi:hypothetical protein
MNPLPTTPTASFIITIAALLNSLIATNIHTHNALALLRNMLNNALYIKRKDVSLQSILQKKERRPSRSTAHNTELSSVAPLINKLLEN